MDAAPHALPDEHTVALGPISLSVRRRAGGRPAVVALHGLASNARWWDLVAIRLAPRSEVVAVDLRGHGRSGRPDRGYSFEAVGGDVAALLAHLDLGPVVLVGHSWGAWVAQWVAAEAPQSVAAIGCIDGGVGDLRAVFGDTWTAAEMAMRPPEIAGIPSAALKDWARRAHLDEGSDADTAAEILLGNFEPAEQGGLMPRLRLHRHMEIARALYDLDGRWLHARLPPVPILFALAEGTPDAHSAARRQAVAAAAELIGDRAAIRWIRGGHDLPVQRPEETAAAIAELVTATAR